MAANAGNTVRGMRKMVLTMAEYIERTDAVKIAEKYGLTNGSVLGRHTGLADCIARDISELPAANVAPVRHGRWETIVDYDYLWGDLDYPKCSVCGEVSLIGGYYCPNCGAKMDGGADDG